MFRFLPVLFSLALCTACAKSDPAEANVGAESAVSVVLSTTEVSAKLKNARPDLMLDSVIESDMPGFYLARVSNGPEVYISKDGQHLIAGDVYKIGTRGLTDLKEARLAVERKVAVGDLANANAITFSPAGDVKASIYVFTDVDCGYCQQLHRQMPAYNAAGIEVNYLAYPRAGLNSPSFKKIVSAWCAADKNAAMTKLKQRQAIPENLCETNPVADHYALGRKFGVRGTPAILLRDGRMLPGYRDAKTLAAELGI